MYPLGRDSHIISRVTQVLSIGSVPSWAATVKVSKDSAGPREATGDEQALLRRIRNGATEEFAEIIQRYQARVFSILSRYERDAQLVQDLAQDTFLKAWRALHQFDGRAPFEHWLSRITVRVAIDHIRARRD